MADLVLVNVGGGLLVWHTKAEWARFLRGVDVEAARLMVAPISAG